MLKLEIAPDKLWFQNLHPEDLPHLQACRALTWLRVVRGSVRTFPQLDFHPSSSHALLQDWKALEELSLLSSVSCEVDTCNSVAYESLRHTVLRQLVLRNQKHLSSLEFLLRMPSLESLWLVAIHPRKLDLDVLVSRELSGLRFAWISPVVDSRLRELSREAPEIIFCNGSMTAIAGDPHPSEEYYSRVRTAGFTAMLRAPDRPASPSSPAISA